MARPYIRPGSKFATSKSWKNSGRADAIVVTRCARYVQKQRDELGLQSAHSWRAWRMTQRKTTALKTIGNVKAKSAWTVWKVGCEGKTPRVEVCCVESRWRNGRLLYAGLDRIMAAAWMKGVKTWLWKRRPLKAVIGKAVWVMSESINDRVRMKENGRPRRDDVTLESVERMGTRRNDVNNCYKCIL